MNKSAKLIGYKVNQEIIARILREMPESKKQALDNALYRNMLLTSASVLSSCTMTVYKEGWYLKFDGTRCSFSVFAKDNDGDLEFIRKPKEDTEPRLRSTSDETEGRLSEKGT